MKTMSRAQYTNQIRQVRMKHLSMPQRTLAKIIHGEAHGTYQSNLDTAEALCCWRLGRPSFASIYNRIRRIDGSIT